MLAFLYVRFFVVGLVGGAVAQDFFPAAAEGLADQLSPPSTDGVASDSAAGAGPNAESWLPTTTDGTLPVPSAEDLNIADALPVPSAEDLNIADALPPPISPAEPEPAAVNEPATALENVSASNEQSSAEPPASGTLAFEPFTTLPTDTAPALTTPTALPGIILRPTGLSLPGVAHITVPLATATRSIASGISWVAQSTTLQTITTATRPNIPLWTASGSSDVPPPAGDGPAAEGAEGDKPEEAGPKPDFEPANHWVLPLNWKLGKEGKGQATVA